jgi:hypothetical protein
MTIPKTVGGRTVVHTVVGGNRTTTGDTKATVFLTYPRYVLHGLLKTTTSRTPCERGGLLVSLLFGSPETSAAWLKEGPPWVGKNSESRVRWVLVVFFIPFHTTTVKLRGQAKSGHARILKMKNSAFLSMMCRSTSELSLWVWIEFFPN